MTERDDSIRAVCPLFLGEGGGSTPTSSLQLHLGEISLDLAIQLVALWHSRLPKVDKSNMVRTKHLWCVGAEHGGKWYAVAIWTNPIARLLNEQPWLELRRLAIADDAPRNTASRMLAVMTKIIRRKYPTTTRLISYQDTEVHTGGIYAAAGWVPAKLEHASSTKWNVPSRRRVASQSTAVKVRWENPLIEGAKQQMEQAA
jgi:hypothetical protein